MSVAELEGKWWPAGSRDRLASILDEVHDEQAAGADFEKLCKDALEALKVMTSKAIAVPKFRVEPFDWTPDVKLETFGSTRQGTALKSSDLDVRMTFEQFEVRDTERQMTYLKGIVDGIDANFTVSRLTPGRVPLLRMRYQNLLDVDLTMGGSFEDSDLTQDVVGVDHYIREVIATATDQEPVLRFCRMVKIFAKANRLVDAHTGFLSSTSWTLLAINFLQLERCLLPATTVARNGNGQETPAKKQRTLARLWIAKPSLSLFLRFLLYMEALGKTPHKVSLLKGKCWSQEYPNCKLYLEYPSETKQGTNIANTLTPKSWDITKECCEKAAKFLRPKGEGLLEKQEGDAMLALGTIFSCVGGQDGKGH